MIRRFLLLTALPLWSFGLFAQMVKDITVSQDSPYTDHLSLKQDSRDMDLMVKFVFNEEANTLTVNLVSYRSLFVFWDQVRYKPTFKGSKLQPKMLPYVAQYEPDSRFKVSRIFKKSVPKPRNKWVFNRWITYTGLQPVPQEYKIVNDYVSQTFDILNHRDEVSVTLRDIFVMENTGYTNYEIFFGKDMFTQYQVTIQRNPCFGKDEDLKSATEAASSVAAAHASFKKKYGRGKVYSEEGMKQFNELQLLLVGQFPHRDMQSDCPDIQALWDSYNQHVDSIESMKCTLITEDLLVPSVGGVAEGLSAKSLLARARQVDQIVSRWLNSRDVVERRDLVTQGEALVKDGNVLIKSRGAHTAEQKRAVSVFRQAEAYFKKTCKR